MTTPDFVLQSVYAAAAAAMAGQAGNPYAALSGAGANGAAGLLGIPGNPATAGSTSGIAHSKLIFFDTTAAELHSACHRLIQSLFDITFRRGLSLRDFAETEFLLEF